MAQDTVRLSCQFYLLQHDLDTADVGDTVAFRLKLANLTTPYAARIQACQRYATLIAEASEGLQRSGQVVDGALWVDSATCYADYDYFAPRLAECGAIASRMADHYKELERQRIEEERRLAEAKARRDAQRLQDSLDARWVALKTQVAYQHNQIESMCQGIGISDKKRLKALADLHYDYLPIYNRFDLSPTQGDAAHISSVEHLERFQRSLLDSVLGPNGYRNRIEAFPPRLKARAGKVHAEVYKSYSRVFKVTLIPNSFGKLEDYGAFLQKMRDIEMVQQAYMDVVTLREEIVSNTAAVRNKCGKNHKNIFPIYESVVAGVNQVPTFSTKGEAEMFLQSLRDFTQVQERYLYSIGLLDEIDIRTDSILSLCGKPIADVAASYRNLSESSNFIPTFNSLDGADFFVNTLLDFVQLQLDYAYTASLRTTIDTNSTKILKFKSAPKTLLSAYKDVAGRMVLTPTFLYHDKAVLFITSLEEFVQLQERYVEGEKKNLEIESNTQTIKQRTKAYSYLWKAYQVLLKDCDLVSTIRNENDLMRYLSNQRAIVEMQQKVMEVVATPEAATLNMRLKNEKDAERIRLTLGLK